MKRIVTARDQAQMLAPWKTGGRIRMGHNTDIRLAYLDAIIGMADTTKWHPQIEHTPDATGGMYHIFTHDPAWPGSQRPIGELDYSHSESAGYPNIFIHSLYVHPDYQGQGMAQALVERLHNDNPHHKINPGGTTGQGTGLTQRILETHPEARGKVDPNWKLKELDEEGTNDYMKDKEMLFNNPKMWA